MHGDGVPVRRGTARDEGIEPGQRHLHGGTPDHGHVGVCSLECAVTVRQQGGVGTGAVLPARPAAKGAVDFVPHLHRRQLVAVAAHQFGAVGGKCRPAGRGMGRLPAVVMRVGEAEHQQQLDVRLPQGAHVPGVAVRVGVLTRLGLDLIPVLLVAHGTDAGPRDPRHQTGIPALGKVGHHAERTARPGRRFQHRKGAPLGAGDHFVVTGRQRRQDNRAPLCNGGLVQALYLTSTPVLYQQSKRVSPDVAQNRPLPRSIQWRIAVEGQISRAGRCTSTGKYKRSDRATPLVTTATAGNHWRRLPPLGEGKKPRHAARRPPRGPTSG